MLLTNNRTLNILGKAEMADIKGGATLAITTTSTSVTATYAGITATYSTTTGTLSVVLDDKRPPRPGGGITTL